MFRLVPSIGTLATFFGQNPCASVSARTKSDFSWKFKATGFPKQRSNFKQFVISQVHSKHRNAPNTNRLCMQGERNRPCRQATARRVTVRNREPAGAPRGASRGTRRRPRRGGGRQPPATGRRRESNGRLAALGPAPPTRSAPMDPPPTLRAPNEPEPRRRRLTSSAPRTQMARSQHRRRYKAV